MSDKIIEIDGFSYKAVCLGECDCRDCDLFDICTTGRSDEIDIMKCADMISQSYVWRFADGS